MPGSPLGPGGLLSLFLLASLLFRSVNLCLDTELEQESHDPDSHNGKEDTFFYCPLLFFSDPNFELNRILG